MFIGAWASTCFLYSCKEYKNLNGFFAITMGLSNPAVCRLNMTWEVSRGSPSGNESSLNLKFNAPFSFHRNFPASSGGFTGSLRTWWQVGPACCSLQNVAVLFSEQGAVWLSPMWLTVSVTPSTGPVQEPPSVPADSCQTGSSHHSFHASADQRFGLLIGWPLIVYWTLLHQLFRYSSRYDVHAGGQQDIYRHAGQFWENGEVQNLLFPSLLLT